MFHYSVVIDADTSLIQRAIWFMYPTFLGNAVSAAGYISQVVFLRLSLYCSENQ